MKTFNTLRKMLMANGISTVGISGNEPPYRIDFAAGTTDEQRVHAEQLLASFTPLEIAKEETFNFLNIWRGQKRISLGLTEAAFQELTYTGKVLECQRWQQFPESEFGLEREAQERGISNEDMVDLVLTQWIMWTTGSDLIESEYYRLKKVIEIAQTIEELENIQSNLFA